MIAVATGAWADTLPGHPRGRDGRALEAARAPLSEQLVAMGIRLPDAKARRRRWKKGEAA